MTLLAAGCLILLLAGEPTWFSGNPSPGSSPVDRGPWLTPIVPPAGVLPSRGGTGITKTSWGFSVQMESGPTVRVGGLATRDACWRVHKTLTDAHPEWTLGDCEEDR